MQQLSDHDMSLLEAYWDGSISPGDQAELERRLQEDPAFRSEAEAMHTMLDQLHALRKAQWRAKTDELAKKLSPFQARRKTFPIGMAAAAAAALVLLLVAVFFMRQYLFPQENHLQRIAKSALEMPLWSGTKMNDSNALKDQAASAYVAGEYAKAAKALRQYLQAVPDDDTAKFYLALALLAEGEAAQALPILASLQGRPGMDDAELAWYRALALLMDEQAEAGQKTLSEISDGASAYQERARKLLKDLQDQAGAK
jgi:TolA-binding protein